MNEKEKESEAPAHEVLAPALRKLVDDVKEGGKRVRESGLAEADEAAPADDEAVHDLRVALRRLRTLLRPARRVYGKRRIRAISDELRRFARATGALRDEEVLRETLSALELPPPAQQAREELDAWIRRRASKERARRAEVAELLHAGHGGAEEGKRWGRDLAAPLARLTKLLHRGKKVRPLSAGALAQRAAEEAIQGVRARVSADPGDVAAMHELRIQFKRLRYTAELLAPLLGEGADAIAKAATRMQRRLGDLHDIDEALARMTQTRFLSAPARAAVLSALQEARGAASDRAQRELAEAIQVMDRGFGGSRPHRGRAIGPRKAFADWDRLGDHGSLAPGFAPSRGLKPESAWRAPLCFARRSFSPCSPAARCSRSRAPRILACSSRPRAAARAATPPPRPQARAPARG